MTRRVLIAVIATILLFTSSGIATARDRSNEKHSNDQLSNEERSEQAASCTRFLQRHRYAGRWGRGPIKAMRRNCLTTIAEVYMFRGFLAHGAPPNYNTPDELDANVEAVKAVLNDDALRLENGFNTGVGDQIAETFRNPVFKVIAGIENLRWTIDLDRNEVFAAFDLPTIRSESPTLIGERFRIKNGLIAEIEAFFSIPSDSVPVCEVVEEIPCS